MKPFSFAIILILPFILAAQSDPNARDIIKLTEWFEGEFDNDDQLWIEGRRDWKGDPEEKHQRLHVIHTRINGSQIGEHVFYVEEYMDDDTSNIVRQRVVSFESDIEQGHIWMRLYFLKDQQEYVHQSSNADLLNGITMDDLASLDGCDLIFKRVGEQYHGAMEDKACVFGEGELERYSVHNVIISENQYWRVDRTFLTSDDSFHKGHPNEEPYQMKKVQYYNCDISFYEKAYYIPSEQDKKYTNIKVHNQGGMAWLYNPLKEKKYGIQLREKEYPFYAEGSDFFMMRFIEEGKKASEVIVTAQPHAEKLSFQIGWASGFCQIIE